LACPYCNSKRILSIDEYRFCCLFEHGEKTLADLDHQTIKDNIEKLKVEFDCEDCGKSFYVIYEITKVEKKEMWKEGERH